MFPDCCAEFKTLLCSNGYFVTSAAMFVFQAVKVLKMNTRIVMTVRFFPYGMYYKCGYTSMHVFLRVLKCNA